MNDGVGRSVDANLQEPSASLSLSAGALLKANRQSAGLHIAALAVQLKVPVHRLEALEADQWEALPDMVFTRALASSVCRTLGVDPESVLALLPANHVPEMVGSAALNSIPVTPKKMKSLTSEQARSTLWWFWGVVIFLALTGGAYFFIKSNEHRFQQVLTGEIILNASNDADSAKSEEMPSPVDLMNHSLDASLTSIQAPAVAPDNSSATLLAKGLPSESMNSEAQVSEVTPVLLIRARGTTWIQIRNSKGKVAVERQLHEGQEVSYGEDLPLSVVVGRSDLTDITVRGRAFDLTKVSRENVARFEVK